MKKLGTYAKEKKISSMRATGLFVDISVINTVTNLANLGISAIGTIKGVDISKKQLELKREIADIQIDINQQLNEREIELLDLKIEATETQIGIDETLNEVTVEATEAQEQSVIAEENLKRFLLSLELEKIQKDDFSVQPVIQDDFSVQPIIQDDFSVQPVIQDDFSVQPVIQDDFSVQPVIQDDFSVQPVIQESKKGLNLLFLAVPATVLYLATKKDKKNVN